MRKNLQKKPSSNSNIGTARQATNKSGKAKQAAGAGPKKQKSQKKKSELDGGIGDDAKSQKTVADETANLAKEPESPAKNENMVDDDDNQQTVRLDEQNQDRFDKAEEEKEADDGKSNIDKSEHSIKLPDDDEGNPPSGSEQLELEDQESPQPDVQKDDQGDLSEVEDEGAAKVTQGDGMGILSPSGGQANKDQNKFDFNDLENEDVDLNQNDIDDQNFASNQPLIQKDDDKMQVAEGSALIDMDDDDNQIQEKSVLKTDSSLQADEKRLLLQAPNLSPDKSPKGSIMQSTFKGHQIQQQSYDHRKHASTHKQKMNNDDAMYQAMNDDNLTAKPMTDAFNRPTAAQADINPFVNEFEMDDMDDLEQKGSVHESVTLQQQKNTNYKNEAEIINESTKTRVPLLELPDGKRKSKKHPESDEQSMLISGISRDIDVNDLKVKGRKTVANDSPDKFHEPNYKKQSSFNIINPNSNKPTHTTHYGPNYTADDDINKDGIIDQTEHDIKVMKMKSKIKDDVEDKIKEDYLAKFRKEVDFHHKVFYSFEKAYRLVKKQQNRKDELNQEIIDTISDHSDYIEQDPLALFYCLYFCVFFNNPDLVEFLRALITKMEKRLELITDLLQQIDVYGIQRLRTIGEMINTQMYHTVFYQAVDDDLRVVYSQILKQLKQIQLRDKDALKLLKQRDYELIRVTFEKQTTKIFADQNKKKLDHMKSNGYRFYNTAFFEEILIDFFVEPRVARNYRERFLVTSEDIYLVLNMYCQNDYVKHFLRLDTSSMTHEQLVTLFKTCIRNDSVKIAFQIYLRFMNPQDFDLKMMEILILSLKNSVKSHEFKLFFILEYFDNFTVFQMNMLIDTYIEILNRKDHKQNPMLSQYNTIKYAMLIYRISWKISQKKIYSLITKCQLLNGFIEKGFMSYLERQNHIAQIYKLMREPIFHMTERSDSLDIMYEMKMEKLLKHPVIFEILNLVYQGQYSFDPTVMNLSVTMQQMINSSATELKSINDQLVHNIKSFGNQAELRQVSLQFNIWKKCIDQRQKDELLFTSLFSFLPLLLIVLIDYFRTDSVLVMRKYYEQDVYFNPNLINSGTPETLRAFCDENLVYMQNITQLLGFLEIVLLFNGLGFLTAFFSKLVGAKISNNQDLPWTRLFIELSIFATSLLNYSISTGTTWNTVISDKCQTVFAYNDQQKLAINKAYTLMGEDATTYYSFKENTTIIVVQYVMILIIMCERMEGLGELIMTISHIVQEFFRFLLTFGSLIVLVVVVYWTLKKDLRVTELTVAILVQDLIDAFVGITHFENYSVPEGQLFFLGIVYIFSVLLTAFLVAMFINRYQYLWGNIDALKRMNIIKLKNTIDYNRIYGGITLTFFPINLVVLPFIPFIIIFKSERLNEFTLKIQYGIMILMYILLGIAFMIPIIPILYAKCIWNQLYITMNKRTNQRCHLVLQLLSVIAICPFVIVFSIIIDITSLPPQLLQDEKKFEFKYQQSLDYISQEQVEFLTPQIVIFLYQQYHHVYKGTGYTLMSLMMLHRQLFKIKANLHDLCCRGTKDLMQALRNVQDYNLSKLMQRKASIPSVSNINHEAMCYWDVFYNVQMDIENYNYIDQVLKQYFDGNLTEEVRQKENERFRSMDEEVDEEKLHATEVLLLQDKAPAGVKYKRDNIDYVNNFFVNIVAMSFTNIKEMQENNQEDVENKKQQEVIDEIEKSKQRWKLEMQQDTEKHMAQIESTVNKNFQKLSGNPDVTPENILQQPTKQKTQN